MPTDNKGVPGENYGFFINRPGTFLYFTILLNNAHTTHSSPAQPLEPGTWFHAAGSYDANAVRIYLDGQLIHEQVRGGEMDVTDIDLRVGHRQASAHFFSGWMDEVAIFHAALSDAEVHELFQANLSDALAVGSPTNKLAVTWAGLKGRAQVP